MLYIVYILLATSIIQTLYVTTININMYIHTRLCMMYYYTIHAYHSNYHNRVIVMHALYISIQTS